MVVRVWIKFVVLFLLLVSPIGGGFLAFCMALAGICTGAMGSGVSCSVFAFSGYFEELLVSVELGFLLPYSFLWIPLGLIVFLLCIYSFLAAIVFTFEASR